MSKFTDVYRDKEIEEAKEDIEKVKEDIEKVNKIVDMIPKVISSLLSKFENYPPKQYDTISYQGKRRIGWKILSNEEQYYSETYAVFLTEDSDLVSTKGKHANNEVIGIIPLNHIINLEDPTYAYQLIGPFQSLLSLSATYGLIYNADIHNFCKLSKNYPHAVKSSKPSPLKTTQSHTSTSVTHGCILALICFPIYYLFDVIKGLK